jgi:hypothetical protein
MNRPSPSRVQVHGPLEAYACSFRRELSKAGLFVESGGRPFAVDGTSESLVGRHRFGSRRIDRARAERFVEHRRASFRVHRCLTLRGMGPLLDHLRDVGVVPAPEPWAAPGAVSRDFLRGRPLSEMGGRIHHDQGGHNQGTVRRTGAESELSDHLTRY